MQQYAVRMIKEISAVAMYTAERLAVLSPMGPHPVRVKSNKRQAVGKVINFFIDCLPLR